MRARLTQYKLVDEVPIPVIWEDHGCRQPIGKEARDKGLPSCAPPSRIAPFHAAKVQFQMEW
eukprot:4708384-Prorocentrum_lima.AAC.1